MKICFLGAASSIHIVRWINALAERGHKIDLITMHQAELNAIDERVNVHYLKFGAPFGYYLNLFTVRRLLREINPQLLHVHYASGYGTLARLANFKPTLLSVWGSDVFLFPYKNKRSENTLRKNLQAATRLTATSHALKKQTELFISPERPIEVVPFGINLSDFEPIKRERDTITIGTVKSLKHVYGIDILLKAAAKLQEKLTGSPYAEKLRIKIVGGGTELGALQQLAIELKIDQITEFVGAVPNEQVPHYLNELDIYCAFSRSESFGVAVLEASACKVPVVVSEVGGLPEVVENGQTGYIVNNEMLDEIVEKLFQLVIDQELRDKLGKNGRQFVRENYDWNQNVSQMESLYSMFE